MTLLLRRLRPMLILLVGLLLLQRSVAAQHDAGAASRPSAPSELEVEEALRSALARGERAEAARLLMSLPLPDPGRTDFARAAARRDLYEAGAAEDATRFDRYLAVANAYADHEEGLVALVAAMEEWATGRFAIEDGDEELALDLDRRRFDELESLLAAQTTRAPNDPRVALAREWLAKAVTGNRTEHAPMVRVSGRPSLPLPHPLIEDVDVSVHRLESFEALDEAEIETLLPPALVTSRFARPAVGASIDLPGPGLYAVALRPGDRTCQVVRRVLESDLDLSVHASPEGGIVVATLEGQPTRGVAIVVRSDAGEVTSGETDERGTFWFKAPTSIASRLITIQGTIAAEAHGKHMATMSLHVPTRSDDVLRHTMHLLVDRPLYRPGETIRGRIVCRVTEASSVEGRFRSTLDGSLTRPLTSRRVVVKVVGPGSVEIEARPTTDELGVAEFEFTLPRTIEPGGLSFSAALPWQDEGPSVSRTSEYESVLHRSRLADVAEFVRPPLLFEVESVEAESAIVISADLPSGIPAAGIAGHVTITAGSYSEHHSFAIDATGRARLFIRRDHLLPVDILWKVAVVAPDGQVFQDSGKVRHVARVSDPHDDERGDDHVVEVRRTNDTSLRFVADAEEYVVGQTASLVFEGPPRACVLLTVARGTIFSGEMLALDEKGLGTIRLPIVEAHAPAVSIQADLVGMDRKHSWSGSYAKELLVVREADRLRITLDRGVEPTAPGDMVEWRLTVQDAAGRGVPASVAMSVVDESLYLLAADRTPDIVHALRPPRRDPHVARMASLEPRSPIDVLGELFVEGRIDRSLLNRRYGAGAGGGASGGAFPGGGARVRSEFRTTAFFDGNIRTDAEGRASVKFRFPDDLATWRVTMHAVGMGAGATSLVERVRTSRSPAVEVRLPRILRAGDAVDVPIQVTQDDGEARGLVLETEAAGSLVTSSANRRNVTTAPGRAVDSDLRVVARSSGRGSIAANIAESGRTLDAIERKLDVADADCRRETFATAILDGTASLEPELLEDTERTALTLTLLGSIDQQLVAAATELNSYPHGCAEQTCSRLLPIVAAAHAKWSLGTLLAKDAAPPAGQLFTMERAQRLEFGLERLRRLQTADGGFGWWPGDHRSDIKVSAGVIRFLTLLTEIGVDPRHYGLRIGKDTSFARAAMAWPERFAALPEKAVFRLRELDPLVDVTASLLAMHPDDAELADLAIGALDKAEHWGVGTIARLGLALHAAGRTEVAARALDLCLARVFDAASRSEIRSIHESPLVRLATILELCILVRPESPEHPRLLETLMRTRASSHATTAANAAVVIALARERRHAGIDGGPRNVIVAISCEGFSDERVIDTSSPDPLVVDLPARARRVRITSSGKAAILAIAKAVHIEPAASARAVGGAARITQALCRVTYTPDGKRTLSTIEDAEIRAGDLVCRRIQATLPPDASYLLLVAPMPAGFEAVRGGDGQVLTDEAVTIGIGSVPRNGVIEHDVLMYASNTGTVTLPPAEVFAMYDPGLFARTEGRRLVVTKRGEAQSSTAIRLLEADRLQTSFATLCDQLARATTPEERTTSLRRILGWPTADSRRWFEEKALGVLAHSLAEGSVFDGLVSGLGGGFAGWFERDGHFEMLSQYLTKDGEDAMMRLALLTTDDAESLRGFRERHRDRSSSRPDDAERLTGMLDVVDPDHEEWDASARLEEFVRLFDGERTTAYPHLRTERIRFMVESGLAEDMIERLFSEPLLEVLEREREDVRNEIEFDPAWAVAADAAMRTASRLFVDSPAVLRAAFARRFVDLEDDAIGVVHGSRDSEPTSGSRAVASRYRSEIERLAEIARRGFLEGLAAAKEDSVDAWVRFAALGRDGERPAACVVLETLSTEIRIHPRNARARNALFSILGEIESLVDRAPYQNVARDLVKTVRYRARRSAFEILDESNRRAVPTMFLLAWLLEDERLTNDDVDFQQDTYATIRRKTAFDDDVFDDFVHPVVVELLGRGNEGQRALLEAIPSMQRDEVVRSVVEGLADEMLAAAPIECLERAVPAFAQESRNDAAMLRIEDALVRSALSDDDIVRRLVGAGVPSWRSMLFFVAARRGVREVKFRDDDPGKPYWSALQNARLGNPSAIAAVRESMRETSLPAEARLDGFRALGDAATADDLRHVYFDDDESFDAERCSAVSRSSVDELRAIILHSRLTEELQRSIARRTTPEQATRLLPAALDAMSRLTIVDALLERTPIDDAQEIVRSWWQRAEPWSRRRLIAVDRRRGLAARIFAACAMGDSRADIRLEAAAMLYRATGIPQVVPGADGEQVRFGPTTIRESREDWSKRFERERDAPNDVDAGADAPFEDAGRLQALALRGLPAR